MCSRDIQTDTEPNDNWLPAPDDVVPLLYGPEHITKGYYELETLERRHASRALSIHREEASSWYQALTLWIRAQEGDWSTLFSGKDEVARDVLTLQMDLLALALSSAKAALDALLVGYYSISFSAIRHVQESFIHSLYIQFFPETASSWYGSSPAESPRCKTMVDQIRARARRSDMVNSQELIDFMDKSYASWKLMSKGSHPSGEGLLQVQARGDMDTRVYGPTYDRNMAMVAFDHGLFALRVALSVYVLIKRVGKEWMDQFDRWSGKVSMFRERLRTDPVLGDLTDKDLPDPDASPKEGE